MTVRIARPVTVAQPVVEVRPLAEALADLALSRPALARHAPAVAAELDAAVARLKAAEVTVAFSGRFKTGKSSLLDAALGERLLPTGDLPETGVSCHVRRGPRRAAALVGPDGRREVACDTDALRKAVTLRGQNERAGELAAVERVDIELPDFPGGPHAVWIDPPGLFDVDAMTERARKALDAADVVVWVLRSQQFLGEAEMEEIANHVHRRGWASVVFVENAFLRPGRNPWGEHQAEVAPVNRGKLLHHAADLGFTVKPPPLVTVSAEAVLTGWPVTAGGRELYTLLAGLGVPDAPRVIVARHQWLLRVLTDLSEATRPAHEQVRRTNQATEAERASAVAAARRQRTALPAFRPIDRQDEQELAVANVRLRGAVAACEAALRGRVVAL